MNTRNDKKSRTCIAALSWALVCIAAFASCNAEKGWIGTWRGSLLVANVEYTFTADTMSMTTTAANGVVIGAARGTIEIKDDAMIVRETERYSFDDKTNTGSWHSSGDSYKAFFKLNGSQMGFRPETSAIGLELTKQ